MWRRLLRIWSSPRTVLRSVLALDDTSHAIALGAAIGTLVGMTPTVGLQTIVVMAIALSTCRLFYFNRAAALLLIYISNPLTVVPIYYGLYWVGTLFLPGTATVDQFRDILEFQGFAGWWNAVRELTFSVGRPLCLGTIIVAPTCGLAMYPATLALLKWFRGSSFTTEFEAVSDNPEPRPIDARDASGDSTESPLGGDTASEAADKTSRTMEPSDQDKPVLSR